MVKKHLSKSSVNLYLQCPLKWKFIHVDNFPSIPSPQMRRGSRIHKEIEEFYSNISIMKTTEPTICVKKDTNFNYEFLKFEENRIKGCKNKDGVFDEKYFFPLHQELKIKDDNLMLSGIIDAVYIHSKDDKIIIIDWKTGKYRPAEIKNYRFELAVYKELFEKWSGKEVGYWGIYFIDANKLFFEQVDKKYVDKMYSIVEETKKNIEEEKFEPKPNYFCNYCEFQDKCSEYKK